jgi:hypothetical protein
MTGGLPDILNIYKVIFLGYWWIWLPVALFFILRMIWLDYIRSEYLKSIKWTLLEISFPREAIKSPKAMEQIFSGLHVVEKKPKWKEKYLKGELPPWFSIEIVGDGGRIRILMRTPEKYRNLIESQIYAQYPDAEILETPDYINDLPFGIPNKDYDIWGAELILIQPDAYPIRTYPFFFQEKEIEERTDPMAGLFEFLSSLNPQEHVWLQILISPVGDDWKKEGERVVGKILGKEVKSSKKSGSLIVKEVSGWLEAFLRGVVDFFTSPSTKTETKEEKKVENLVAYLSPGQKEVVSAIEANIAKLGFRTMIREIYWAHKDVFSKDKTAAVGGFFKQFNTQNLNGFKPNKLVAPGRSKIFKKRREPGQKKYILRLYKNRQFIFHRPGRGFIFNTEELATVFHIPLKYVKVERIPRIEAKKGGPPTSLPTI